MRYAFYLALLLFSILILNSDTSHYLKLNNTRTTGTVPVQLTIDANGLRVNCIDQLITISVADQTLDNESFQWFENGVASSKLSEHQYFAATSGAVLFSFVGLGGNDCVYLGEIEVDFSPCDCNCDKAIVPNVLSPNGDGVNDRFRLFYEASCPISNYQMVITKINTPAVEYFSSGDINTGWDGTDGAGDLLPTLTPFSYGVIFTIGDENCHFTGDALVAY